MIQAAQQLTNAFHVPHVTKTKPFFAVAVDVLRFIVASIAPTFTGPNISAIMEEGFSRCWYHIRAILIKSTHIRHRLT